MQLSPRETKFLSRRRQLLRAWRITGPVVLLLLLVTGVLMFINYPLMFNPFEVVDRLESQTLDDTTLQLMALLLPVTMLMVFLMLVVVVLLVFAVMANDKKYLAILDRLNADHNDRSG
ncbi:MAG: hypothetical protein WBO34_11630 [Gammaproteobacteria bacterium]